MLSGFCLGDWMVQTGGVLIFVPLDSQDLRGLSQICSSTTLNYAENFHTKIGNRLAYHLRILVRYLCYKRRCDTLSRTPYGATKVGTHLL